MVGPSGSRGILDPWHPKEASPARRNPREHSRGLSTEWRTLSFQARPLPAHVGLAEALLSKVEQSSLRAPASSRAQRPPESPRRQRGGGDQQPQATADPEGSRLTPHPWRTRARQPPSRRVSLLTSTCFLCRALRGGLGGSPEAGWSCWGARCPWPCGCSLHTSDVFNCTPPSPHLKNAVIFNKLIHLNFLAFLGLAAEGLGRPTWEKLLPDLGDRRATWARMTEPHPSLPGPGSQRMACLCRYSLSEVV